MNYVIRYHSKGDKDSYLTNTALLSKKIGSKDILNFSSAISAQNYFNHSLSTKKKETILNNHAKECFQIVKINDNNAMPRLWENTGNELLEVFPESIDQLIDKLINTSNVMIMDLEFFNDNREDHTKE